MPPPSPSPCDRGRGSERCLSNERSNALHVLIARNPKLLHPETRRRRFQIQQHGRTVLALDHSARLLQHGNEVLTLDFFKRCRLWSRSRWWSIGRLRCQRSETTRARRLQRPIDRELRTGGQNSGALDDVL